MQTQRRRKQIRTPRTRGPLAAERGWSVPRVSILSPPDGRSRVRLEAASSEALLTSLLLATTPTRPALTSLPPLHHRSPPVFAHHRTSQAGEQNRTELLDGPFVVTLRSPQQSRPPRHATRWDRDTSQTGERLELSSNPSDNPWHSQAIERDRAGLSAPMLLLFALLSACDKDEEQRTRARRGLVRREARRSWSPLLAMPTAPPTETPCVA